MIRPSGGHQEQRKGRAESAAASVGLAAVVRLRAASTQFASFCLCHSARIVPVSRSYRRVHLSGHEWERADVALPVGFWQRLRGIAAHDVASILIRGRSVHTFGLRSPIAVCAIDEAGRVLDHRILPVASLFRSSNAAWILELSPTAARPAVGVHLTVASSGNARNAHRVRNTHRTPR